MIIHKKHIRSDVYGIFLISFMLIIIGLLFIYSSSSVYAMEKFGQSYYYVKKQLYAVLLGFIGLCIARSIPMHYIKRYAPQFFFGTVALTSLTLISKFSSRIHGSSRWVNLAGFSFQPSELLKISLIIYLAYQLAKQEKKHTSLLRVYLPIIIIMLILCAILLKQPDFGLTVTLCMTAFALLFVWQLNTKYILIALSGLLPAALMLVLMKPYRLKRILTFLDPWADPQGSGFQIIQSLIAIGSGNFWGLGISMSRQKFFYLPMQHTDFIFSIIAEETGFIGCSMLITLYGLLLYFGMRLAWQLQDIFARLCVFGFITLISLQTLINLAVATGLAPTKGIGLPFVSYGNTALICNMIILGLIINMAQEK